MFDRILVPVDGSDESARALDGAVAFARAVGASLHAVSVVDVRDLETAPDAEPQAADAATVVEETLDDADAGDLPATTVVRQGIPDEVIRQYAADNEIDLIVMGTHGRTGVRRFLLGSVTEKVVRLSDVPVLVVHVDDEVGGRGVPYRDVLVPTDGSEGASAAVAPAASLARTFDATVHVVSVVDTGAATMAGGWELLADDLEAAAETAVADVAADLADHGVDRVETAVEIGTPYRALRDYVEAEDVDLVAMGTHGRSGIERYLLGSVTEKLLRTSPAPVLTVRIDEDTG
jgi:nucleotide-binding universal stress UspA family protein